MNKWVRFRSDFVRRVWAEAQALIDQYDEGYISPCANLDPGRSAGTNPPDCASEPPENPWDVLDSTVTREGVEIAKILPKDRHTRTNLAWKGVDKAEAWKEQQGRCAICRLPFKNSKDAHRDHCHAFHMRRDLLCSACNSGLGRFKDNSNILRRAAAYIEKWHSVHIPLAIEWVEP